MSLVSILIPCYNEQASIQHLLAAIYAQTYPHKDIEVVIADGLSTDGTRAEIEKFQTKHPALAIRVVDNPKRIIPAAINQAIKASGGEILIRMDAHSRPYPDYVERCVSALEAGVGENIGGVLESQPGKAGWLAEAIAAAAVHPLAVGDALYRHASRATYVDTVSFFAIKRELLALVGFFDESLSTNEDYEFNVRIRKSGGRIWLDPAIRFVYTAQTGLGGLANQYWRYGYWKWRMLRRYPQTVRWRQALPPLFILDLIGCFILGFFLPIFWFISAAQLFVYAVTLFAAGIKTAIYRKKPALLPGLPLAIMTMHFAWGTGFLWSMINWWKK